MIKPWYWRSLPLENRTGSHIFASLFYQNDSGIATLLESPYPNKSDRTPIDLIRALFPGGTITGCPKVRCMEIIEELEPLRRNLFYGSCGYARLARKPRLKYLDPHPLANSLIPPIPQHRLGTSWCGNCRR